MLINRHLYNYLENWSERADRMPLILRGARQVGKTTLVRQFSVNYDDFLPFNLEKVAHRNVFEVHNDMAELISALFLLHGKSYDPQKRYLIFIDEAQEYPPSINQLRYFYEEYPDLHVILTGSLLDFALKSEHQVPVGRVEYAALHPINFMEFLDAAGNEAALKIMDTIPVPDYAIQVMYDHFHDYINVGGMPKAVATHLEGLGVSAVQRVYNSIIRPMHDDVEKYARNSTIRQVIRHIMNSQNEYVGKRITFEKFGGSNYKSREVGEAFRALEMAHIVSLVYPSSDTSVPASVDQKKRPRLHFLDIGLINYQLKMQLELLSIHDISKTSRGSIIEQVVIQEYNSTLSEPNQRHLFWARDKKGSAEVDLILQVNGLIIPIEMKSGPTGKLRSLHEYMDRCDHHYGVRLYRGKWQVDEVTTSRGKKYQLLSVPYFMAVKIREICEWFLQEY